MLEVMIKGKEMWDENSEEFVNVKPTTLRLEHSLVSISKWESKWKIPFLDDKPKTAEQSIDYIKCMTLNQNVDDSVYYAIDSETMQKIDEYIGSDRTATWFNEPPSRGGKRVVTSELVYYFMIAYNIPFECQKWHFSRLMTLIKVCKIETSDSKMSRSEVLRQNRAMNAARRKAMRTKG